MRRGSRGPPRACYQMRVSPAAWIVVLSASAVAQGPDWTDEGLARRLERLVASAPRGARVGIAVADAATGQPWFRHAGDVPLNPASNVKLVTAALVLDVLGPAHAFETTLHGSMRDGHVETLVLRGRGDPSLRTADLAELVRRLVRDGLRSVGRVAVDGTWFEPSVLPPAYDQRPDEAAAFRAPVGAVAVDGASFWLRVRAGSQAGAPARVETWPPGYFDLVADVQTVESGSTSLRIGQVDLGARMRLEVRGRLVAGSVHVERRRVEHPLHHAGQVLAQLLREAGVSVAHEPVVLETRTEGTALLASHRSAPLAQLLHALGKHSDNFAAETLLRAVAAERTGEGSTEAGLRLARELMARAGVPESAYELVNGSGLYAGNRLAPDHLVALLVHVHRDSRLRPDFLAQLAIGGVDGTLARRLRALPAGTVVRAKTGTLAGVVALSGYVLGDDPDEAVAFSVLVDQLRRSQLAAARSLADEVATMLAERLAARRPPAAASRYDHEPRLIGSVDGLVGRCDSEPGPIPTRSARSRPSPSRSRSLEPGSRSPTRGASSSPNPTRGAKRKPCPRSSRPTDAVRVPLTVAGPSPGDVRVSPPARGRGVRWPVRRTRGSRRARAGRCRVDRSGTTTACAAVRTGWPRRVPDRGRCGRARACAAGNCGPRRVARRR
ncbi:MAG: D-alanyl-D-alanine carboxypeptidase/D-alanyl-D-alanine-endopeptidase [Myxococcota bacterium]|nr:D-alanyl-D-alanine carboxypeptidase/D-alanyl-D-alanine-endopeptidase [Myxococcota bacterium]MDW8361402.1 D-alanyl-D-alanine carboxypeptidase/D-alanyl-D-alanine-endopeptidase [Myxococcales bacterium]